jgi:hypothetical protein
MCKVAAQELVLCSKILKVWKDLKNAVNAGLSGAYKLQCRGGCGRRVWE